MENCVAKKWKDVAASLASIKSLSKIEMKNKVSLDEFCLALSQSTSIQSLSIGTIRIKKTVILYQTLG